MEYRVVDRMAYPCVTGAHTVYQEVDQKKKCQAEAGEVRNRSNPDGGIHNKGIQDMDNRQLIDLQE